MEHPRLSSWEDEQLAHFVVIGRELAATTANLRAAYVTAHLTSADGGVIAFTCQGGAVHVTGRGFEVELSATEAWRRMA